MDLTQQEIQEEISKIDVKIRPWADRRDELERDLRKVKSANFITAFGITLDNIEMSKGTSKPFFHHVYRFGVWLKEVECQKEFCEWNGRIYFTAEVIGGHLDPNATGRVEDLKGSETCQAQMK